MIHHAVHMMQTTRTMHVDLAKRLLILISRWIVCTQLMRCASVHRIKALQSRYGGHKGQADPHSEPLLEPEDHRQNPAENDP